MTPASLPGAITMQAQISNSLLEAFSISNAADGAGLTSATATAIGDDKVNITLASGSDIRGEDGVYRRRDSNYHLHTDARGNADISIHAGSYSNNFANSVIEIDAEAGARSRPDGIQVRGILIARGRAESAGGRLGCRVAASLRCNARDDFQGRY